MQVLTYTYWFFTFLFNDIVYFLCSQCVSLGPVHALLWKFKHSQQQQLRINIETLLVWNWFHLSWKFMHSWHVRCFEWEEQERAYEGERESSGVFNLTHSHQSSTRRQWSRGAAEGLIGGQGEFMLLLALCQIKTLCGWEMWSLLWNG